MEVRLGLVRRLEVRRLGDPLASEGGAELVVHHLDLLVDQDVRELDGGVGDRIFDDPVGEAVTGPVEGIALEALADLDAQRRQVGEVAHRPGELVVRLGQHLLAELLDLDREVGRRAGQLGLAVVGGKVDVELGGVADRQADEMGLEAGDEPLLAEDERHPLGRPALERDAVAGPDEPDDRVVARRRGPVLDRSQRGVLVAQLVDHGGDLGVVDGLDLRREREARVVAELDLRWDLHDRREPERLPLLGLDDVDGGLRQRDEALLASASR